MNKNEFIEEVVIPTCKEHGITINRSETDKVTDLGIECNGFFDAGKKMLAWADGSDEGFYTLVHEYAHMLQWITSDFEWLAQEDPTGLGVDAETLAFLWTEEKVELTPEQVKCYTRLVQAVELGCERRVLKLIEKHNLSINIELYLRKANSYVMFWAYLGIIRKWYTVGKEPYTNKNLLEEMPTTLLSSADYEIFGAKWKSLFDKYMEF